MTTLLATRSSQSVQSAKFTWNFNDDMLNTAGVSKNFGSSDLAVVVDAIRMPVGAIVVGGALVVETAFDTAGYDVLIGDSVDTDRYFASADVKAVSRTALVPTGYRSIGNAIRITIASDDVCTTGKATLTVDFIMDAGADEVI